jgi:ribosomal protein L11 methyltransferase
MPWIEFSIDTADEGVDWVRTLLATTQYRGDLCITPYSIPGDRTAESNTPAWAFTLHFYLPYEACSHTQVEAIEQVLSPLHRTGMATALQTTIVEQKPEEAEAASAIVHRIGQRFVVLSSDANDQATGDEIPLTLVRSLSFGSGFHPATRLSLQLLERYVLPGMQVLDLGSGSGILSVAMAKLGASVLALDNDSLAVQATQEMVQRNGVEHQVTVMQGSLGSAGDLGHWLGGEVSQELPAIRPLATFDLIVANILGRLHLTLAQEYHQALRRTTTDSGILITAGFTTDYETEVDKALTNAGFDQVDCDRHNEWVALAYRI